MSLPRKGMRFNNVFAASPTCAPSRAALFTGLNPIRNGAHPNHSSVKPGMKSLPHYLSALGYRVILLDKSHLRPPESFPFEYYPDKGNPLGPGEDLLRILEDPGEKPFCIILGKFTAHVPWPDNKHGYRPEEVDIPPHLVDTPETRQMRARYYSKITDMDLAVGRVLDLLKAQGLVDNTLTIYATDHGTDWPNEKWNLNDGGLNVPFIARWPGEIEPGTVSDALVSLVDIVPTFIDIAGGDVSRVVSETGGEELDGESFLPVLLGQRTEHHAEVYGNFTWGVMHAYPMRSVRTKTHRYTWNIDFRFRYNWPPDTGWWGESRPPGALTRLSRRGWPMWESWFRKAETDPVIAARLRAIQYRPSEELYDIRTDPYELKNIAEEPDQKELLLSLRRKVRAWMEQQGDTGDSAYHREAHREKRFLDEFYGRQVVVNARLYADSKEAPTVELTCPIWQAEIRYTLNGTEPTRNSRLYDGPFAMPLPATLRAKGFFDGGETPLRVVQLSEVDFRFHYEYHYKPGSW